MNQHLSKEDIYVANKHEKKLNITDHQRNANQNYNLTPVRMAIKKPKNNRCWEGCGEERMLLHCWWVCKLVQSILKTVWQFLKDLEAEIPFDLAIPLLGIYPKEYKSLYHKDTCTRVFIAALFTIAKTWNQPKCPLTADQINKMWYMYTMEYYAAIKRTKLCPLQQHGWSQRLLS